MDLAEAVYGERAMSARRIAVLTLNLPISSTTMQILGSEMDDPIWERSDVLSGMVVESLDALHRTLVKVNGGKPRGKPLQIVPRPTAETKRRSVKKTSTLDALSHLDRMRGGGEG